MKYSINIDQINSLAWDLNLSEAAVFTYLFHVPIWADPVLIDGKTFYFAARQKTCQDVPLISDKPDTIYRIYKSLAEKGVIEYLKWMGRDCMRITEKGKGWNSEKNPSNVVELGKKSESTRKIFRKDSEKNPTYNSTIDNHTILLGKEVVEKEFSTVALIDEVDGTSVKIHHVPEWFENDYKKEMATLQEEYEKLPKIDPNEAYDKLKQLDAELKAFKATQKKEKKISAKRKEKVTDDPAPITPMWQEYEKRFADLNAGEPPVFHKKYLRSLKTMFAVLRERTIKKGIVPLNDVQPWCDFLDMAAQHLRSNPKETYLRGRFDPIGIEAEFNKWITTLNNRPKTDAEKWMDFARRNGVL